MSKRGEIGKWVGRYDHEDIVILCLLGIAILSLLTVLGWAYFVIDIEFGVDEIIEAILGVWECDKR